MVVVHNAKRQLQVRYELHWSSCCQPTQIAHSLDPTVFAGRPLDHDNHESLGDLTVLDIEQLADGLLPLVVGAFLSDVCFQHTLTRLVVTLHAASTSRAGFRVSERGVGWVPTWRPTLSLGLRTLQLDCWPSSLSVHI